MAITVPFDLAYEFEVNALAADVFAVLSDVPASASHFPKLEDLGGNSYRWETDKVGTAQMNIQTAHRGRRKQEAGRAVHRPSDETLWW